MHFAFVFPRFKLLSGAERLILRLADALVAKGHAITLLAHQFDESCRSLLPPGVALIVTGERLDYVSNRYVNAAFDYWRAATLADRLPAGVDAVCCFGPALAAAPRIRRRHRVPVLYFCYEPPRFLYTDHAIVSARLGFARWAAEAAFAVYRSRDRRLVREMDAVLCNSFFGRRQIQDTYGLDAHVITHGLDPYRESSQRDALRRAWGVGPDDVVLITVNYLHPRKRVDLFLGAIAEARRTSAAIRAVVVGDGPEREALERAAPPGVHFAGFVPDDSLADYFQAADIYLHTGRLETFGLSVIEASGNGLPVVTVDEGGPTETVVHGQTGIRCAATAQDLASGVLTLVDRPRRVAMGEAGRNYVRSRYSWQQGADDFLTAVRAVPARGAGRYSPGT